MLSLARSIKNSFASISRIPPEVLSLIAHHCDEDEDLITLTHVCRSWREIFTSHASLWTNLDCADVEKTSVYLERSKASPLDIYVEEEDFVNEAFLLTVPHLGRLGSLTLRGSSDDLPELTKHLRPPAPFLKKLALAGIGAEPPVLQQTFFNDDLSSLQELRLEGVIVRLAWESMSNLRMVNLSDIPSDEMSVTQLLDFFEHAPLLRKIRLDDAFPDFCDAQRGRRVALPNLKFLIIDAKPAHIILTSHLLIPEGATINQTLTFTEIRSPILSHLPSTFEYFKNLSHISSINLDFHYGAYMRLDGPTGALYMYGDWDGEGSTATGVDRRVLHSLNPFPICTVERLAIRYWRSATAPPIENSSIYNTFLHMSNLRTLRLTRCFNLPFASALNPKKNPSGTVLCPKLEELIMYIHKEGWFCIEELSAMTKARISRGAKLETIKIVSTHELAPTREVLKLRAYVSHVEYRLDNIVPVWDAIRDDPSDPGDAGDESD